MNRGFLLVRNFGYRYPVADRRKICALAGLVANFTRYLCEKFIAFGKDSIKPLIFERDSRGLVTLIAVRLELFFKNGNSSREVFRSYIKPIYFFAASRAFLANRSATRVLVNAEKPAKRAACPSSSSMRSN